MVFKKNSLISYSWLKRGNLGMITFALLLEGDCLFNLCFSLRRDSLVLLDEASQLKLLWCVRCVSCIFLGCQNFGSQWVKENLFIFNEGNSTLAQGISLFIFIFPIAPMTSLTPSWEVPTSRISWWQASGFENCTLAQGLCVWNMGSEINSTSFWGSIVCMEV